MVRIKISAIAIVTLTTNRQPISSVEKLQKFHSSFMVSKPGLCIACMHVNTLMTRSLFPFHLLKMPQKFQSLFVSAKVCLFNRSHSVRGEMQHAFNLGIYWLQHRLPCPVGFQLVAAPCRRNLKSKLSPLSPHPRLTKLQSNGGDSSRFGTGAGWGGTGGAGGPRPGPRPRPRPFALPLAGAGAAEEEALGSGQMAGGASSLHLSGMSWADLGWAQLNWLNSTESRGVALSLSLSLSLCLSAVGLWGHD